MSIPTDEGQDMGTFDKNALLRLIKQALSDIDDCERKIRSGDTDRALYELGHAEDCLKKALRLVASDV